METNVKENAPDVQNFQTHFSPKDKLFILFFSSGGKENIGIARKIGYAVVYQNYVDVVIFDIFCNAEFIVAQINEMYFRKMPQQEGQLAVGIGIS